MANRLQHLRRTALTAAGAVLVGAAGCAFPNGSTGGDPILGSFNRPIVPTPPPERGGIGLDSPAYDAGARIGVAPPDVAAPVENSAGGMSLPQLTSPSLFTGARLPFGGGADEPLLAGRPAGRMGARLPSPADAAGPRLPAFGRTSPDSLSAHSAGPNYTVAGGSAFTLPEPRSEIRPVSFETLKDPAQVKTMEDGQAVLQVAGARGLKVEQLSGGEWVFACTLGAKAYQARGNEPLDAMKAVLEQVQRDR